MPRTIILDDSKVNKNIYSVCSSCQHFNLESFLEEDKVSCKAFNDIPKEIWEDGQKHNSVIEGQSGDFVFTQKTIFSHS